MAGTRSSLRSLPSQASLWFLRKLLDEAGRVMEWHFNTQDGHTLSQRLTEQQFSSKIHQHRINKALEPSSTRCPCPWLERDCLKCPFQPKFYNSGFYDWHPRREVASELILSVSQKKWDRSWYLCSRWNYVGADILCVPEEMVEMVEELIFVLQKKRYRSWFFFCVPEEIM